MVMREIGLVFNLIVRLFLEIVFRLMDIEMLFVLFDKFELILFLSCIL